MRFQELNTERERERERAIFACGPKLYYTYTRAKYLISVVASGRK